MTTETQGQDGPHFHTSNLASYFATLTNTWGCPYVPIFFYPPRLVSCDGVCFSRQPVPELFLVRVRFYSSKKAVESTHTSDLPHCAGLLRCLHSDRQKERAKLSRVPVDLTGDSTGDTFVVERTVFPFKPLTTLENLLERQSMLIPACALQIRRERGAGAQPFSPAVIRHLMTPVADTLACLHRAGFAHNNVRPENILVSPDLTVYLYGIDSLPSTLSDHVRWRSPELAKVNDQPSLGDMLSGDVWAFGFVLLYLATLIKPFYDERDSLIILSDLQLVNVNANPLSRQRPSVGVRIRNAVTSIKDADIRELVTSCLSIDVNKRPSMERVRSSSFFNTQVVPYAPTTYGTLVRSTYTGVSETMNSVESYDTLVQAVAGVFSDETLGPTGVGVMAKNAILLNVLEPIHEEDKRTRRTSSATSSGIAGGDAFAQPHPMAGLGANEAFVALPLLELIREFPTSCGLSFTVDAFVSTSDSELYQQCVEHAERMLQRATLTSLLWSAKESKEYAQHSMGESSSSISNYILAGTDCVFVSDIGAALNECQDAVDDEEQESNVIDGGILTLDEVGDSGSTTSSARDEHKVEALLRDSEPAEPADGGRRGHRSLKRTVIVFSATMLVVVTIVGVVVAVVLTQK